MHQIQLIDSYTSMTYDSCMKTVIETDSFHQMQQAYWSNLELEEFIAYIATNYQKGDVVSGTGGVRKIRWTAKGKGKSGGVRIIYFNVTEAVVLLTIYGKNVRETIPANILRTIKQEFEK